MSRKFVTELEIAFINKISHELVQTVSGQEVKYYPVLTEKSLTNRLYSESIQKIVGNPISVNARVKWNNPATKSTGFGPDTTYDLEIFFHELELKERNLDPKEGDFVEYSKVFFEITSVLQPQLIFGQQQERLMTRCICVPAREGQFQFGGEVNRNINNSHPTDDSKCDDK